MVSWKAAGLQVPELVVRRPVVRRLVVRRPVVRRPWNRAGGRGTGITEGHTARALSEDRRSALRSGTNLPVSPARRPRRVADVPAAPPSRPHAPGHRTGPPRATARTGVCLTDPGAAGVESPPGTSDARGTRQGRGSRTSSGPPHRGHERGRSTREAKPGGPTTSPGTNKRRCPLPRQRRSPVGAEGFEPPTSSL